MNKPYKFVVTCVIQQKGGTSHCSTSCHWENTTDAHYVFAWPPQSRQSKDMKMPQTIITVFGTRF